MNKAEVFGEIVSSRRTVREYTDEQVSDAAFQRSIELAMLAPNSSNLQLWEFYRVKTPEIKKQLAEYCMSQKAAVTAPELLVVVARKDKWKSRAEFVLKETIAKAVDQSEKRVKLLTTYYTKLIPALYMNDPLGIWGGVKKLTTAGAGLFRTIPREVAGSDIRVIVHKSVALAAQTFMLSMKAEGYDTCPMEGFDSAKVKSLLKLPAEAEINMIISVGKGTSKGIYGERVRVPKDQVVFEL